MTIERSWQDPDPAVVPVIRAHVLAHVEDRLAPDEVRNYATALTEILVNAVEAQPPDSDAHLTVAIGPDVVVVSNPSEQPVPTVNTDHEPTVEGGRGLHIATTLWPALSWETDGATLTTTLPLFTR